jgi:HTH-type transcriptional repressor of puuD
MRCAADGASSTVGQLLRKGPFLMAPSHEPDSNNGSSVVIRASEVVPFERGTGIRTLPLVGKWNNAEANLTTGMTEFPPGTGIPLHAHNVEETVLILEGSARVELGDEVYELGTGDATWVPPGVPHRFINVGNNDMRIYWVYAGNAITRTLTATGETFEHLSEQDRIGTATS